MSINNAVSVHELIFEETRISRVRARHASHTVSNTHQHHDEHLLHSHSQEEQEEQHHEEEEQTQSHYEREQRRRRRQREFNLLKWAVLSVTCFTSLGSAYIFDFPGSIGTGSGSTIESLFREHDQKYTQGMNQLLYSVYSWPNTVLAMIGGLLIDKYLGLRRATLIFSAIVCSGAFMFYLGVKTISYPLLLLGRVFFGLGGESLGVAQSAYVARWFSDGIGMPIAFCITVSFARVGSSFNFLCSPAIAKVWGVDVAALWGVAACLVSFMACIVLVIADEFAVRLGYLKPEVHHKSHSSRHDNDNNNNTIISDENSGLLQTNMPASNEIRDVTSQRQYSNQVNEDNNSTNSSTSSSSGSRNNDTHVVSVMRIKDIFHIPGEFWLLCGICTFCYGCTAPFIGMGRNFFEVKYGYSGKTASQYLSSYQLTSAIGSPFVGILVDFAGRNTWWLLLSSASFVVVHFLFLYTMFPALVLLVYLGLMASFLSSSLWPAVPWVVQPNMVGFSYGVMTAIQNIGLAVFPIIVGLILDHYTPRVTESVPQFVTKASTELTTTTASTKYLWSKSTLTIMNTYTSNSSDDLYEETLPTIEGYRWAERLFIVVALISLAHCIALFIHDKYYGRQVLSVSGSRRKAILTGEEEVVLFTHNNDDVVSITAPLLISSANLTNERGKLKSTDANTNNFLSKAD